MSPKNTSTQPDRALLAAIIDSTDDAVVSIDADGRISSWNRGAAHLYGFEEEDAAGRSFASLVDGGAPMVTRLTRVFEEGSIDRSEIERSCRDGTSVMVEETLSPVRDDEGRIVGVASIARDIGSRLAVEAALAETRSELESQNRRLERSNADLEQFAYIASHDLSEPLRAVAGMVGLLARRYRGQLDADADEFIAFAVDGCERMRTMIEDLLVFSRVSRGEMQWADVDLASVVEVISRSLCQQVDAAMTTIEVGDLPVVRADRSQITQVCQNLVSNAVKFRRAGEPVTVSVTATELDDGGWKVDVADNGIGIEPQYRERIFRMFQRLHTSDDYPGSGIGLAISERIVDRHGGTMGVDANSVGGSTFWFTLAPIREDDR